MHSFITIDRDAYAFREEREQKVRVRSVLPMSQAVKHSIKEERKQEQSSNGPANKAKKIKNSREATQPGSVHYVC